MYDNVIDEPNMFVNQIQTPMQITNTKIHPDLTKIITNEFEYYVPDGTFWTSGHDAFYQYSVLTGLEDS